MMDSRPVASRLFGLFWVVALGAQVGCGKGSPSTPGPTAGDAGGTVYLWERSDGDGGSVFELDALFPDPSWAANLCDGTAQVAGSCCYAPATTAAPASPAQLSSGDLTVTDVTSGLVLGRLAFSSAGGYPVADWTSPGWSAGDVLDVKSAGGDVPTFEVQALAPAHISGLQPAWTDPVTIFRATDFVISWTPDRSAQTLRVVLSAQSVAGPVSHGTIVCQVPDSAGTLTVPSALLQNFVSGDVCGLCVVARGNDSPAGRVNLRIQTRVTGSATYQTSFQ